MYYAYTNFRFSIFSIIKNSSLCRYLGNVEPTLILRPTVYLALKGINYIKGTNLNLLVKSGCHLSKKNFFCLNESCLKIIQNTFYFMLKALFILVLFKFLSWLHGYVKNGLKRIQRVFLRFMTSQIGQQIIIIHTLLNV